MSEYRSSTVSAVSGSEYGFVTLLDESASESHTQNSTRTAPYLRLQANIIVPRIAKASAIYRIEKPRNPENRRKIGKI